MLNIFKLSISLLLIALTFPLLAFSADSGDRTCGVFLVGVENIITGGSGNYYSANVAVRNGIGGKAKLQYRNRDTWLTQESTSEPTAQGEYLVYSFRLSFGAVYNGDVLDVVPFVSFETNRIYDNNFSEGRGYASLDASNNWRYLNGSCQVR